MSLNLPFNLSVLEDEMPRLNPQAAAGLSHIHPMRVRMFTRPLEGPVSLDSQADFVAAAFAAGVPGNASMGPEGDKMVARWVVPMEDYPRNRHH